MKNLAIKAENISKQYRLGEVGTGTLSHDLNRLWSRIRGKGDPYLKVGESNDRTNKAKSDYVWSLRDLNFEIEKGDAVGIIGRNGAGKSTLLKLLSKVTKPTTGNFKINGRIASLLEVGTGFNPEMTGRENIYMNGAMLGMRRQEITRKFDEIVDFSGVEKYIDTPVKRYSSGMYVRLAFAVAAHLESEILIVDEVLAVGDAEFQKKCLGKMGSVSQGEGRTVLFVSHNMTAISTLCNKGIYLNQGEIYSQGNIKDILIDYREVVNVAVSNTKFSLGKLEINNIEFSTVSNAENIIYTGDSLQLNFCVENKDIEERTVEYNCEIYDTNEVALFCIGNQFLKEKLKIDAKFTEKITINFNINLLPDKYYAKLWMIDLETGQDFYSDTFLAFEVEFKDFFGSGKLPDYRNHHGSLIPDFTIKSNSVK